MLGIGFITIYEAIRLRAIELAVTTQRVVFKRGVIGRETEEVRLTAIETIDLHQTPGVACSVSATCA